MPQQISLLELADRIAIRHLVDAYAHCADRRDAVGQMALFTTDTVFEVFMDGKAAEPTFVIRERGGLAPVFADLNQYAATTHFNGQSTGLNAMPAPRPISNMPGRTSSTKVPPVGERANSSNPNAANSRPNESDARIPKRTTSLAETPSENTAMMMLAGRNASPTCMAL